MSWLSSLLSIKKRFETPLETLNNVNISESAILQNFDYLTSLYPEVDIFPVLKSNAYGHGIEQVAKILKKRKTQYIVVDSYYEALQVHAVNPVKILLIGYNLPENYEKIDFDWVTPVVTDLEILDVLGSLKQKIFFHIKIDTGMGRQGISEDQIDTFLEKLKKYPKLILEGACTHLADADNPTDDTFSFFQAEHFKKAIIKIESAGYALRYKHISNSAGHLKGIGKDFANASRIGISLYGVNPLQERDAFYKNGENLSLALELRSTIVSKKHLLTGESVSYGLTFRAPWDMEIGIVPVGYYEGLPRVLSGENFSLGGGGKHLPILGRICMNMCIVDITNKNISVGDTIIIYSREKNTINTVEIAANKANTIAYEVLTHISESIRRKIVD